MKRYSLLTLLFILSLGQNACRNDYVNPSAALDTQAVNSPDALAALVNGLAFRYTIGRLGTVYNAVAAGGLTTRELRVLNAGNTDELFLEQGGASVQGPNAVIRNLWTSGQLVRSNADIVLENTQRVVQDEGFKSGLIAYSTIYRSLALGTLAQFFEQMPVTTGKNAPFVPRIEVLKSIVQQLETAATLVAATPPSAGFVARMAPGMDVANTLQALIARYSLMAGDNDKAIAAAGRVNLAVRSVFSFDDNTRNPVFETAFSNVNVFAPQNATLGLPAGLTPDAADRRSAFYLRTGATSTQNLGTGFYTAANQPVPVYLSGEMLLIRAEAFARKGELTNATAELNKVLTKTPAQDVFGVGAGLPVYAGAVTADVILAEIYRNRQIELAFQGFRLEDSRRFGRSGPGTTAAFERNRNFLPYPLTESDNNKSTPTNLVL